MPVSTPTKAEIKGSDFSTEHSDIILQIIPNGIIDESVNGKIRIKFGKSLWSDGSRVTANDFPVIIFVMGIDPFRGK